MKTEISRNVVLDLLPLYLADEASEDTRRLVESYLQADPELADIAKHAKEITINEKVPIPIKKEDAMESYKEAKRWMVIRTLGLTALGTILFLCTLTSVGAMIMMWLRLGF